MAYGELYFERCLDNIEYYLGKQNTSVRIADHLRGLSIRRAFGKC